jgi:hypothetical protein
MVVGVIFEMEDTLLNLMLVLCLMPCPTCIVMSGGQDLGVEIVGWNFDHK